MKSWFSGLLQRIHGFSSAGENDVLHGELKGQRLTLPLALEDGRLPGLFKNAIYVTAGLFLLAFAWATFGQIRELAVAHGKVIPSGSIKLVHHLEGGQVEEVFVQDGQLVEKGERILRLRPTAAESDLSQLRLRAADNRLKLIRLNALVSARAPDFGRLRKDYPEQALAQIKLYNSQVSLLRKERITLESQLASTEAEVRSLSHEAQSLARRVDLLKEEVDTLAKLRKKRLTTRRQYISAKSNYEKALAESISVEGRLAAMRENLVQAHNKLEEWSAQSHQTYADERSKLTVELAELHQSITKHADRVNRLFVYAPVRGVVQQIVNQTPGEVIRPGGLVAKIVPAGVRVFAEVELDPKDVGHIMVGDEAQLKISTYDPNTYGLVDGVVQRVSPTTFQPDSGPAYYKVLIAMEKSHIGASGDQHLIAPGMEVQANIVTGAKSLMIYLLKPVNQSLRLAFTER
ncbi:MAG: HlyD family type I secretion periplasmic adaptor subunit [Hyphomicrobiaceae bacterium]